MDASDNSPDQAGWRPSADLEAVKARADLLATIRTFFAGRGVLEVETPALASCPVTDPGIDSIPAGEGFLQTSPEFHMKRLLCAENIPVYQVAKVFRAGEKSRRHNPEFSMLEWYRPGFSLHQLMEETVQLLVAAGFPDLVSCSSWNDLFRRQLGFDAFDAPLVEIQEAVDRHCSYAGKGGLDRSQALDLLFSEVIEPGLGNEGLEFVTDWPAWQSALAIVAPDEQGHKVALRFEVFYGGMELGNAYQEEWSAAELRKRFEENNRRRELNGATPLPLDESLLAAVSQYKDKCAGISLGLDRMLMLLLDRKHIDEVILFPGEHA